MQLNLLVAISLLYVMGLFLVAFIAEQRAQRGKSNWIRSPFVYTLSLSVYCTGWTFFGAVGFAARSGLEYLTIYLGPTLMFVGWFWVLRKLVRIGRAQRATSIADLISARYGKSNGLAVLVTFLAVVATAPYIALQLQTVTLAMSVISEQRGGPVLSHSNVSAFWTAIGLAVFTVIFGTRNLDANERHHGVVMAIAVEAVVKLIALLAVGIFVVWGVAGGIGGTLHYIDTSPISAFRIEGGRWLSLTFLAGCAVFLLPRMFQVMVVEIADERHLSTASWAFPLYMLLISLFVVPIAAVGLQTLPEGANPDSFVLTLPLSLDNDALVVVAFLGGFSSATSMVIVAAIALSTMVSNHVVMPLWLAYNGGGAKVAGDMRRAMLITRRVSIAGVIALGYAYYVFSSGTAGLAQIGLISFAGMAQLLPAVVGGVFWRGATRRGAAAGMIGGFIVWAYTLYLPSFGPDGLISAGILAHGPYGLAFLRPEALFGMDGMDPLVHAVLWSMAFNTGLFLLFSLASYPSPMERLQGVEFVNVFDHSNMPRVWSGGRAEAEDLMVMAQRILGPDEATQIFFSEAQRQGKRGYLPDPTPEFLSGLERELAGTVGAGTAHAMVAQIHGGASISVTDLMAVADETAQIREYSMQLERQSVELQESARQLQALNEKLTKLSIQKDAFLSQISHELRTPMTSIRSFSEILQAGGLDGPEQVRYAGIIQDESMRLTRLLDDLLDLSVLENGQVVLNPTRATLASVIDRAVDSASATGKGKTQEILRDRARENVTLLTDTDRLSQVFINLIANAAKYAHRDNPTLRIDVNRDGDGLIVDFIDNGPGIPPESQTLIFEKFARLDTTTATEGIGLGLAICREIMARLGGAISYIPDRGGAAFRLHLPIELAETTPASGNRLPARAMTG